jgi:Glycine-rich domain-containing protein-like
LSELVSLTATGILPRDISFLQCFVDAGETTAHALRDAVLRQVSFIDKMDHHLWIRSPVLDGTLQRARSRYGNFLRLFKLYPTTMFVPTLDIDLVWHTHQCSAYRYFKATKELAGKFVNHDDSIVEDKLTVGLTRTRDLYRVRFGQEYLMCGCWDCEALLSAVDSSEARPGEELDWEDVAKEVGGDVAYYWAVEVARRKKEPIPIR